MGNVVGANRCVRPYFCGITITDILGRHTGLPLQVVIYRTSGLICLAASNLSIFRFHISPFRSPKRVLTY